MAEHRFVFVGGLHRSGTTLLARALSEHPDVSGFHETGVFEDEGQHLQTVYPPARAFGGPGRFGFAPAARLTERSSLATPANARRLFDEWAPHWDLARPVLLEKSPPNLIRARFLQAMFPGARFVMIRRHPVATSLATRKWCRTSLKSLLAHWVRCHRLYESDRPSLRHALELRYEDLIARPEETLRQVCEFLEVEPFRPKAEIQTDINRRYFERWIELRRGLATGLYIRALEILFQRQIRPFGYSFSDVRS